MGFGWTYEESFEGKQKRIMIKGFGYYESSEASFELAKFKAQLVMMNWISIK